jgi:SAM-dependent methyltransferase
LIPQSEKNVEANANKATSVALPAQSSLQNSAKESSESTVKSSAKEFAVFGSFRGFLEETQCPICESPPTPRLIYKTSEGIGIQHCPQCEIYYASPRFDEASLLEIYENEDFKDLSVYDHWSYEAWASSNDRSWIVANLKVALAKRFLPDEAKILDVGCGVGDFPLVALKNKLKGEGIDTSKTLTEIGRRVLHAPVQQSDVEDFDPPHRFDGVFIWDVLEHLYDPVRVLRNCHRLLKPGGYLFAQVPNSSGLSNRLKSFACRTGLSGKEFHHFGFPYHIYFFNQTSLTHLMNAAHLRAVHFVHIAGRFGNQKILLIGLHYNRRPKS